MGDLVDAPTYTTCLLSRCHSRNNCRGEPAVIALSRSWPSSSSSLSSSSSSSSSPSTTTASPTRVESTSRKLKAQQAGPRFKWRRVSSAVLQRATTTADSFREKVRATSTYVACLPSRNRCTRQRKRFVQVVPRPLETSCR